MANGGQKKGRLETTAAFPVLCASCGGSTTHVLRPPLKARDTQKEILQHCQSTWPQHGVCKHAGTPKCLSHQEGGFIALNLRLSVAPLELGALRFPGESVRERVSFPSKDPCQRWDDLPSAGIPCPEEAYSGLWDVNLSPSMHPFLFHITVSTFGSRGFFAHTIFFPLTKPVLKSCLTISQMPLNEQLCATQEH